MCVYRGRDCWDLGNGKKEKKSIARRKGRRRIGSKIRNVNTYYLI